jgi:hypothetical protein
LLHGIYYLEEGHRIFLLHSFIYTVHNDRYYIVCEIDITFYITQGKTCTFDCFTLRWCHRLCLSTDGGEVPLRLSVTKIALTSRALQVDKTRNAVQLGLNPTTNVEPTESSERVTLSNTHTHTHTLSLSLSL